MKLDEARFLRLITEVDELFDAVAKIDERVLKLEGKGDSHSTKMKKQGKKAIEN